MRTRHIVMLAGGGVLTIGMLWWLFGGKPWKKLFSSGFESEGIQPYPTSPMEQSQWIDYKWYPERPSNVVYTEPVGHNSATSAVCEARNMTADGNNVPQYFSAILLPITHDSGVVADAKKSNAKQRYYFMLPPETIAGGNANTTYIWNDIELFTNEPHPYDPAQYHTDWLAPVVFNAVGTLGHLTEINNAPFSNYGVPWAVNQFTLQPNVWYMTELEVDFKNKVMVSFHLEGGGINKTWTPPTYYLPNVSPPTRANQFNRQISLFNFEGFCYFAGINNESVPALKAYFDDIEGSIRVKGFFG